MPKGRYNVATSLTQERFNVGQKDALPTKVLSLRPRKHSSTGRLYFFWLLPTKKDPMDVQSGRPNNKSVFFLQKN